MSRRNYCFTAYEKPEPNMDLINYIIWGEEYGKKEQRLHWQGYVEFGKTHQMPAAQRIIGAGKCHLECRKGTKMQAREYCMKDGKYEEMGSFEMRSTKDILKQPKAWIKEHEPLMYVRYHRGIDRLQAQKGPKWRDITVNYLWGPTGSGKTRQVMELDDVYKLDAPYTWWDGYEGESILLIDDYQSGMIARSRLLNLLDGYQLRLETKGGHTYALWTTVYITSNYKPTLDSAMARRVTSVRAVGNTGTTAVTKKGDSDDDIESDDD